MLRIRVRVRRGLLAVVAVLVAVAAISASRMFAHTPTEQVVVTTFAPSFISGYHFDGGFVADDLDPRTSATKLQASLDLSRVLVATDRYLLSANQFSGLALAVVDRATGVELPRPRTTQVTAGAVVASPDGRYAYLMGSAGNGTQTVSVIDLRPESATFDTEIKTVAIPANGTAIGMTIDSTGTRLFVLFTTNSPTASRLMTVDVTTPSAATVIQNAAATEPTFGLTPGFEQAGNGRLHVFSAGGSDYLIVPRRQTQIYRIVADGSLVYVQSLPLALPGFVRDAVYATTAGAPRIYAITTNTASPFLVNVVAYDMSVVGGAFAGTNIGQVTIDSPASAESVTQIAASLDGSRVYLARVFGTSTPGTLVAVDAAAVVTSPGTAVLATQALTGINGSGAVGLAVTTQFTPGAAQPTVTGVAVDGVPNAILINSATHTLTVTGTHLDNIHQAFIGLTRATVVSASSNSVTVTAPALVPANTAPLVLLGNDGTAAGTITVANAPDYLPSFVVYASQTGTNKMSVLNAATGSSVVHQFASGFGPADAAPTADGRFLVVGNFRGNGVTIHSLVDDPTHSFVADQIVAQPTFGAQVQRVVVSPTRKRAYAAALTGDLIGIIDTDADSPTFGTVLSTFSAVTGASVRGLAISPDGNTLYIGRQAAPQLLAANISTDTVPAPTQITLGSPASASGRADGIALSPDGARLYFMNSGDSIMRIFDTSTPLAPSQISTVALPGAVAGDVHRIQVLPNNRFVYVASRAKATVDVFDTTAGAFVASVATGAFSNDPAVSRNSHYVFVGVAENDSVLTIDARETVDGLPNPALHRIVAATGGGSGVTATSVSGGFATSGGPNITVTPAPGVAVTFANVTTPGLTTATSTNVSNVPLPPFYFNGQLPVFVNIESSVVFSGPVSVCLHYDDAGMTPAQELAVRILHLSGGVYVDATATVDTAVNVACGSSADLGQFVVALYDGDAPVITTPADQTLEAAGASGAMATFAAATAVDPLSGLASLSCDHSSGETFPIGATTVTCTATDNVGHSGSAAFSITVVDTTPPTIDPLTIAPVTATSGSGAIVTYSNPAAVDIVDGPVGVVCTPVSGSAFPIGTTSGICSATDSHANTAVTHFSVTVNRASTTTVVTCPVSVGYTGTAQTPCSANVTGAGGFTLAASPSYGNNTAVGTATANYAFAGDATHAPSVGSAAFAITPATLFVKLSAAGKLYDGSAVEPDASMSCALTGVIAGDTVTCTASNGTFGSASVGATPVTATVTIGGAQASNYTLGAPGSSITSTSVAATAGGTASLSAEAVYGQNGSFISNGSSTTATGLNRPYRVSLDSTGGLYVAEENNHRVVYYPPGSTTATRVYGQAGSFTSGDPNHGGLSANSLQSPRALKVDSHDNLYIVDGGNHRVLFFPKGSTTATRVYGQLGSFTTSGPNQGGGITANNLNDPNGVAIDANDLVYIADQVNNRVLTFAGGSTTATGVYGQTNFTSGGGGVGLTKFNTPSNMALDAAGNLYLSDEQNHRILFFPIGSTTPTRVYGQNGNFTTNSASTTATGLNAPRVGGVDANNNLYVADRQNNRVLFFPAGSTTATRVYGQNGSFTTGTANNGGVSAMSFNTPIDVGVGPDGKIYVPDYANNRVLRFVTGGSGSISAIPLTVTLAAANKVYDATTTEPNANMSCTVSGLLPVDAGNVICTATSGSFNSQSVGTNFTVTATITISGAGAGNYTIGPAGSATQVGTATTTASITLKSATATIAGVNKPYDGTAKATITCTLSGLAANDSFVTCGQSTNAANTQFDSAAAGTGKTITANNLIVTNSSNYTITNPNQTTTANILTKQLTTTLTAAGKGYDGTTTEPNANMTCAVAGVVAGDSVTCAASNGAFSSAAVGSGNVQATLTISGAAVSNYTLGLAGTATLSITSGVAPGTTPDFVIGQPNFTVNSPSLTAAGVVSPTRVSTDASGGVYVAQDQLHRVLYFPAGSATATVVYGQGGVFTTNTANKGGISANSLNAPKGVRVDASGNVYIADTANNRVLFFVAGSTTATRVYGQTTFTGSVQNAPNGFPASATGLNQPTDIATDATGVYIADSGNSRVLFYAGTSTTATRVYGQSSMSGQFPSSGPTGMNSPQSISLDSAGNLYAADTNNSRVLFYVNGSTTPTRVYGQNGNFNASGPNAFGISANSLNSPRVGGLDSNDNLYVADTNNHRVLFFPAGSTTATRVYGQSSFTVINCNSGGLNANSLCAPYSATVSADGRLYIADQTNNRVLRYALDGSGKIGRGTVTATLAAADKDFDGNTSEPDAQLSCTLSGVAAGDAGNVTCTATGGSFDASTVGTHTVTATVTISGSAVGNYTLGAVGTSVLSGSATATSHIIQTITTVTAVIAATDKVYDGTSSATATCTLTGVTNGDPVGCAISASPADTQFSGSNAGAGLTVTANNITLTNDAAHHYVLASTTATTTASITQASSTTTVSCAASATYSGAALELCSATVTGAGSFSDSVAVAYSNNIDAGEATGTATFGGDANHTASSGSATFTITAASSTTVVTCPGSVSFTGAAQTPCTATVMSAGGFTASVAVDYTSNTNVGAATASANFGGDPNHSASSDSKTFNITSAGSATSITCPSSVVFTGTSQTACTAVATGVGGLNVPVPVTYTNNVNAGTATANATFAGDGNHDASVANATFSIAPASSTSTIICPATAPFTGMAVTPCTAKATGAGGLNVPLTVGYTNNVAVGSATASASFAGDVNHTASSGSATFAIAGSASQLPGRMQGNGRLASPANDADMRLQFDFDVAQVATGQNGGRLSFWTSDRDDTPRLDNTFDSTSMVTVSFSDDPTFLPGGTPTIDTVLLRGTGNWNGVGGYSFEARATDQGEPGVNKDTFSLTVYDSTGAVVWNVGGKLVYGNVASMRLPGRNARPLILNAPADQVGVEATSAAGAVITYPAATAVDKNGVSVPVACRPASGSTFPLGRTRGTCTATDSRGATSSVTFLIWVVDTQAPTFTGTPASITVEADRQDGAAVSYATPVATDRADTSVSVRCTPASGRVFALGTTQVACTATDNSGNTATTSFSVTVRDTTPPVFTSSAGNIVSEATSTLGDAVNFPTPRARDDADNNVGVTCSQASGSMFPIGVTTVICTAVDSNGNRATTSFTVTVRDTTAPKITVVDPGGSYALNAVVRANFACTDTGSGVASCVGTVPNNGTLNTSVAGTYTFTVTATDAAGNTATKSVSYTVKKK